MSSRSIGDSDWDNSAFNQILNRTKQNLNRINQRYAPSSSLLNKDGADGSSFSSNFSVAGEGESKRALSPAASARRSLSPQGRYQSYARQVPTVSEDAMFKIHERLSQLEENAHLETENKKRLIALESSVDKIHKSIEMFSSEVKDIQKSVMQIQSKVTIQSGLIDIVQQEIDHKRGTLAKMDSWSRQGEIWREEIEDKLTKIERNIRNIDQGRDDRRDIIYEYATKYDLNQLRDAVNASAQSTVASSMASWRTKVENNLRDMEQQLSTMATTHTSHDNSGTSVTSGSAGGVGSILTGGTALFGAAPAGGMNETVLKRTVITEVAQMEKSLEDKLILQLKSELSSSVNTFQRETNEKITKLLAMSNDNKNKNAAEASSSRGLKKGENTTKEVYNLTNKINDLADAIVILQDNFQLDSKTTAASLSQLDRKVDESINISESSVSTVQKRAGRLEDLVREAESSQRERLHDLREELLSRLSQATTEWSSERLSLDRRLLVNERVSEDCVERLKLSSSVVESHLLNSSEFKRLNKAAETTESLLLEVRALTTEMREQSGSVVKLRASTATKNDYLELRERIMAVEPSVWEKLPEAAAAVKRLASETSELQGKVQFLDSTVGRNGSEIQSVIARLAATESTAATGSSTAAVALQEVKSSSAKLAQLESHLSGELGGVKEQVSSLSNRISSAEGRISSNSKAAQTENSAKNAQLQQFAMQLHALERERDLKINSTTTSKANETTADANPAIQLALERVQAAAEAHRRSTTAELNEFDERLTKVERLADSIGTGGMQQNRNNETHTADRTPTTSAARSFSPSSPEFPSATAAKAATPPPSATKSSMPSYSSPIASSMINDDENESLPSSPAFKTVTATKAATPPSSTTKSSSPASARTPIAASNTSDGENESSPSSPAITNKSRDTMDDNAHRSPDADRSSLRYQPKEDHDVGYPSPSPMRFEDNPLHNTTGNKDNSWDESSIQAEEAPSTLGGLSPIHTATASLQASPATHITKPPINKLESWKSAWDHDRDDDSEEEEEDDKESKSEPVNKHAIAENLNEDDDDDEFASSADSSVLSTPYTSPSKGTNHPKSSISESSPLPPIQSPPNKQTISQFNQNEENDSSDEFDSPNAKARDNQDDSDGVKSFSMSSTQSSPEKQQRPTTQISAAARDSPPPRTFTTSLGMDSSTEVRSSGAMDSDSEVSEFSGIDNKHHNYGGTSAKGAEGGSGNAASTSSHSSGAHSSGPLENSFDDDFSVSVNEDSVRHNKDKDTSVENTSSKGGLNQANDLFDDASVDTSKSNDGPHDSTVSSSMKPSSAFDDASIDSHHSSAANSDKHTSKPTVIDTKPEPEPITAPVPSTSAAAPAPAVSIPSKDPTTGAPLSIKERLRLRQEALKMQRLQSDSRSRTSSIDTTDTMTSGFSTTGGGAGPIPHTIPSTTTSLPAATPETTATPITSPTRPAKNSPEETKANQGSSLVNDFDISSSSDEEDDNRTGQRKTSADVPSSPTSSNGGSPHRSLSWNSHRPPPSQRSDFKVPVDDVSVGDDDEVMEFEALESDDEFS